MVEPLFAMPATIAFLHLMVSLSAYASISGEFTESLRPLVELRRGRKGERLVQRGRLQQRVWFIHQGTAREVTLGSDKEERTSWFWTASDFLFTYPGFFAQEPAMSAIELIEDSLLMEISLENFLWLKHTFAQAEVLVEKIRSSHERARVLHAKELVELSAKERYQKLFEQRKPLFKVAKQKDIASFLGIKSDGFHRYQ